jgi:hypothetical protein
MSHVFATNDGFVVLLGFLWLYSYFAYTNLKSATRAGLIFGFGFVIIVVCLVFVLISLFGLHT